MKRLLFTFACLLHVAWAAAQFSGSGSGTESDPYLIFNETQLSQMGNFLNQEGVVFRLMKDLNLTTFISENSPSQGWQPIGVGGSPFKGKLLGNNKTVSGLTINRSSTQYVGFFGYMNGATVSDLTIEASTIKGGVDTGVFAGYVTGSTITNVTVNGTSVTGGNNTGGFAGSFHSSTLTNCHASFTGSITGGSYVGGLLGYATNSTVKTFDVVASVSGSELVGGVVGWTVTNCSYTSGTQQGNITASGKRAGGFAGEANAYILSDFTARGNIKSGGSDGAAGGLVGISGGTASHTNCSHLGDVESTIYVGGIVGRLSVSGSSATFTSCSSNGKLTNTGNYTGGVVGISEGACIADMQNCSHFGDITGKAYVGGLVGAVIKIDTAPTLHTYKTSYSKTYNSEYNTYTEEIVNGTTQTKNINNCTAIGDITGTDYVGGLIGSDISSYSYSRVSRTGSGSSTYYYLWKDGEYDRDLSSSSYYEFTYYDYNRNSISYALTNNYYSGTLQGSQYVGGLVGQKGGGTLQNNYSYASIYGSSNVGGIAGNLTDLSEGQLYTTNTLKSNISNCAVISATTANVGRIYGSLTGTHHVIGAVGSNEGNRALTTSQVSLKGVTQEIADNEQNGTSIGPSLLRLKATYVAWGWNFNDDWDILETESYPYKRYQAAPPVIESTLVSQATAISGKSVDGGTVHLYYKGAELGSTKCDGNNNWMFSTEALQSGAPVRVYTDVAGKTPSYFTSASVGFPGSGTEDDPWRIYTAEDLQGATKAGYYKLMNDVDLSSWIAEHSPTKGWLPIGHNGTDATYIDGDSHKVTGLWTNTTEDYTGLFSNFSAGQIKNLNVEIATGKQVKGGNYTGGLIGRFANGKILNCNVKGNVQGTQYVGGIAGTAPGTALTSLTYDGSVKATAASAYVGGIAGHATGAVSACTVDATVTSTGSGSQVGGLVGHAEGTITGSHAIATVTGAGTYVGGLVGYATNDLTKCLSNSSVTASGSDSRVGGLAGYTTANVSLCIASGTVTATGSNAYTGGLVGYSYKSSGTGSIANCYSTANVSGTQYTAGLVGYAYNTVIDKCYAKGDINGVLYGGGLVGELEQTGASLTNSVALANTLTLSDQASWGSRVIGGYKSGAADPEENNYALSTMQVSLNNVPQRKTDDLVEGIAKTQDELQLSATYMELGWDFENVWAIDEGEMYPYLLWEIDVNPVAEITFDKSSLLIAVGKTETVTATVLPLGATNKRLTWTSDNTAVATVEDGTVTAIAVGTANIIATATDGSGVTATCRVTVTANKDAAIAELQAKVDEAQDLYDNSTEGDEIGQYAAGARATLLVAIRNVRSQISSTMEDATITQCMADMEAAIQAFQSKKVTAGEDTDIATLDNVVYINKVEAAAGQQLTLSIKMKNTAEIQGFGFDLYLPDGVTIATDEDGFDLVTLSTERTTDKKTNYFDCNIMPEGFLRVLASSTKGYTISGTDGEIVQLVVNIDKDMEEGDYPIILKEIALSDNNSQGYETSYVKSTLTISSYNLGDVNGDTKINVIDFTAIANHILGKTPEGFIEKAADVSGDGKVNVIDLTAVANIILYGSTSQQNVKAMRPQSAPIFVGVLQERK